MENDENVGISSRTVGRLLMVALAILFTAPFIPPHFFGKKVSGDSAVQVQQKENLAKLFTVKRDDLVLCVDPAKASMLNAPIKFAVLVLLNRTENEKMTGLRVQEKYLVGSDSSIPYTEFTDCEVRIVERPFSYETIGRIVTHGLGLLPRAD